MYIGCLPAAQLNLPESMTTPPMEVPWPPSHLVRECVTIVAPCSSGFVRYGVLKVESTISGRPWSAAILAMASRSLISSAGLEQDCRRRGGRSAQEIRSGAEQPGF